jgi:hypothetical protein
MAFTRMNSSGSFKYRGESELVPGTGDSTVRASVLPRGPLRLFLLVAIRAVCRPPATKSGRSKDRELRHTRQCSPCSGEPVRKPGRFDPRGHAAAGRGGIEVDSSVSP